jgi:hypothetical protein
MKLHCKKTLLVLFITAGLFITKEVKGQPLSFADALVRAVPGKLIQVTISTNQDNGVVTYMTGTLAELKDKELQAPGSSAPWIYNGAPPLSLYSSDRTITINSGPNKAVMSGNPQFQPFRYDKTDPVAISIVKDAKGVISATFTMLNAGNTKNTVTLQTIGDLLYGVGAPIAGNQSKIAVYIIAFTGVTNDSQKSK